MIKQTVRNTATALLKEDFADIDYIVKGLIGEGLTLFGGKPKLGKSIFVLNVALSVSSGFDFLGRAVKKGVVAYLSLENGKRTTKKRLGEMLGRFSDGDANTDDLLIENKWGTDPISELDNYLSDNADVTFVIIDTLMKFFSRIEATYNNTYIQIDNLRKVSSAHDVPILVIDHLIKSDSSHLIDMFSNSNGKTGAADNLMGLLHSKKYDAELHVMGRDVEDTIIPLEKLRECKFWDVKSEGKETVQKDQLLAAIKKFEGMFSPLEVAEASNVDPRYCRKMLHSWEAKQRYVQKVARGQYKAI